MVAKAFLTLASPRTPAASARHSAAETRGGKVEQIVELRRGPAEGGVALGAVADHAVGGVGGLIGGHAGQAEKQAPDGRGHHTIGEILGEAFDRGTGDARLIEIGRVAADDLGHRLAAGLNATRLEGIGNRGDVLIEAAARDQRARDEHQHQEGKEARQQRQRQALDPHRGGGACSDNGAKRERPVEAPPRLGHAWRVEASIECIDQRAHPHHRMLDATEEEGGIAEARLHQKRADDDDGVER